MPRFFMSASTINGNLINIMGADADHIRVLRMKIGEALVICTGEGTEYHCHLTQIGEGNATAEIDDTRKSQTEASVAVTILAGMPKGDKAELIVQKCCECGAVRIAFFLSERCVSRPDGKSAEKKRVRWQRIAEEAAKQSGRGIIPEVLVLPNFSEAIRLACESELPLLMYETGDRITLKSAFESREFSTASIITGPEGGFEEFEVAKASEHGIVACAMGPRILRCETAPISALSALMYATGNM